MTEPLLKKEKKKGFLNYNLEFELRWHFLKGKYRSDVDSTRYMFDTCSAPEGILGAGCQHLPLEKKVSNVSARGKQLT